MDIIKIRGITLFVVALLNLFLVLALWYKSKKDKARIWLGYTALFSGFYAFFCGATYFFWDKGMEVSLGWYKATWLGVLLLPCFIVFTYYFTGKTKNLYLKAIVFYGISFVIVYLSFTTDLFVKSLRLNAYNISSLAGPLDPFGRVFILFCLAISITNLLKEYFTAEGFRKIQIRYFILGTSIFVVTGMITTSIIPFIIKESPYYDIAAYLSFVWIGLTSYAILKYKLMDIKIITTELFSFALWITLALKIFLSENSQDRIINIGVFLAVLFFGIFLIRSVTKEVRQKEQLEKLAKEIEGAYEKEKAAHEVEKKAREELESLGRAKNQFLLAIQHHLRTPLTAMIGYSDLILNGAYGKQSKKMLEVINKFQASTKSLIKMVNEFLDITQFQLGKEVVNLISGIEIEPIISEIAEELKFETEKKGIYLKLQKPEKLFAIKADREKLKAALYNIIDNAVKYTLKGGVDIKIESKDVFKIIIKDTGIGMSQNHQKNLFNKTFERGEEAKKTFTTGRGIGLYIASEIIKAHKGKIWADSEGEGKGSTFHIELPYEAIN